MRAVHGKVATVYIILALSSAILFGLWKFGIGQFRGRISTYSVVLVSASSAAIVYGPDLDLRRRLWNELRGGCEDLHGLGIELSRHRGEADRSLDLLDEHR